MDETHTPSEEVEPKMITRDWLAVERTKLANERTFLAYFRTGIVMLGTGITILKLESLSKIYDMGYALSIIAPIILLIGVWRFYRVKGIIKRYYS